MYNEEQIIKNLRSRHAQFDTGPDGGGGYVVHNMLVFNFIYSFDGGWEHVSVSTARRCPTWEEMCFFKDIFWPPSEECVQYHPNEAEYVNCHKYCLHIWRPIDGQFPIPPKLMIGF